jgi:hypothetical protein
MSDRPRRRRRRGLAILIAFITLVLLAEAALVVAVFVSPSAGDKLEEVAASAERAWVGTDGEAGIRARTAETARRAYREWVQPLWRGPEPPAVEPEFTACVDCHPDYASQRSFGVYMNHPLHAEIGVRCKTCHPDNPHPNPPRPQEDVCADCHPEVQQSESCGFCHPPGSLPHFYLLGAPRDAAVRCDVCHPKGAFEAGAREPLVHDESFSGTDPQTCRSCHEESTCTECHAVGHPSNWLDIHGLEVGYGGSTTCYRCHTGTWCGTACHSAGWSDLPFPLPSVGVRP